MINVSSAFKTAMQSRTNFTRSAVITLADGTVLTLGNSDFTISGNRVSDSGGGSGLPIGTALCRTVELELVNNDDRYAGVAFADAEIELTLGFNTGAAVESFVVGTFTVRQPETYGNTVTITAMDDMYKAEHYFETALTYPATAFDLFEEICAACGIDYDVTGIPAGSFSIQTAPSSELTYRQVLGYIAMLSGGNARISRERKLEIVNYDFAGLAALRESYIEISENHGHVTVTGGITAVDSGTGDLTLSGAFTVTDDGEGNLILTPVALPTSDWHDLRLWKNLRSDREDVVITGVETTVTNQNGEVEILTAGTEGNVLPFVNPLIAGNETAALGLIGAALIGAAYRPFSGEHIAYPLAEFGDIARVSDGLGRVFWTVLTEVDFAWNAVTTFGAGGESSDLSAAGTMEQNITRIAADLAQFARLKVSWADIQEAIIEYLKLYGTMTVYTDSALTTEGGKLGYTTGNLDLPMQIGMILASALLRGVAIVSDEGSYLGYKGDSDYTVDYTMDGQGNVDISDILYGRRLRLTDSGADLRGGARLEQSDIPPEGEVPLAYPHAPSGDVNIMPGGNGEVTVAGFPLASSEQIVTGTGELGDPIVLTEALVRNWVYPSELYYAGGDTFAEANLVPHAGVITTGSTAMWLSIPVDKSLENIASISVTSLIGGARISSGGYVNGYGDSTEWVGRTGLTFTAAKAGDRLVTVRVDSATDYTDGTNPVTNNTPITLVGRITLAFT